MKFTFLKIFYKKHLQNILTIHIFKKKNVYGNFIKIVSQHFYVIISYYYSTIFCYNEKKIFTKYYKTYINYSSTLKYSQNIFISQMLCGKCKIQNAKCKISSKMKI